MFDEQASLARATAEGCRQLVDELVEKGAKSVALLVADRAPLALDDLVDRLRGARAEVMGAVFPGLIVGGRVGREGALALGFSAVARRVVFRDLGGSAGELENEMSRLYNATRGSRATSVLLFLDAVGAARHTGRFIETLQLYFHVSARYLGGGAGRTDLSDAPCLFTETEILPSGAAMALRVDKEICVSYRHGWTKLAGPFFVSRAENTGVLELDWQPASEVYAEVLKNAGLVERWERPDLERMAPLHPLGLHKLGELLVVRDLLTVGPDGGLQTFGKIPQYAVLSVLQGEPDSLLAAARQVADEVRAALPEPTVSPRAFVADCVTREIALGPRFHEELGILTQVFGKEVVGALTLGEIASGRDRFLDFFNKTIVVGAS